MSLAQKITEDLKTALKNSDTLGVSVLRMLSAALHNRQIEKRTRLSKEGKPPEPLTEEEELEVALAELKKRKEAKEAYQLAGRKDLADKEEAELNIISRYLPSQLSEKELDEFIQEAIKNTNASSPKDLGRVMGYLAGKVKGRADLSEVSRRVIKILESK
ncbi:MAG: GatB/YqeY domain-containing protein [Candidatus Paceibacteria bacterium]